MIRGESQNSEDDDRRQNHGQERKNLPHHERGAFVVPGPDPLGHERLPGDPDPESHPPDEQDDQEAEGHGREILRPEPTHPEEFREGIEAPDDLLAESGKSDPEDSPSDGALRIVVGASPFTFAHSGFFFSSLR